MNRKIFWMGLPLFLAFLVLMVLPFGITLLYSLQNNSFDRRLVGFKNYWAVWHNSYFQMALRNTAVLMALVIGTTFVAALWIGYLLYQNRRHSGVVLPVLLFPLLLPSASVTTLWRAVFQTSAFSSTLTSYLAIVTLFLWKYTGVGVLLVFTGLEQLPSALQKAASLDGASRTQIFFRISLPLLRKRLVVLLLFLMMYALRIYKESYLLFGEYPSDCMYLIQHYMSNHFTKLNFQNVAAGAVTLVTGALLVYGAFWLLWPGKRRGGDAQ